MYCKGQRGLILQKCSPRWRSLDLEGGAGTAAYTALEHTVLRGRIPRKASHAGFAPGKGIHAIAAAADAVSMLPMGNVDEETTVNVGTIKGGIATNIIPDSCIVKGEVRSLDHEKALKQAELVKKQFERSAFAIGAAADFELVVASKAYRTPPDHPVAARFENACGRLGLPVLLTKTMGGQRQHRDRSKRHRRHLRVKSH